MKVARVSAVIPLLPAASLFIIVLWVRRWVSRCEELLRHAQTIVLPLRGDEHYGERQIESAHNCAEKAPVNWLKSNGSMMLTRSRSHRRSSTGGVLQTRGAFVRHRLPHAALTALIYTQSNPLVCLRNDYIFVVWIGWLPYRFVTPSCWSLCINQCLGGLERQRLYLLCFLASSTSCTRG